MSWIFFEKSFKKCETFLSVRYITTVIKIY